MDGKNASQKCEDYREWLHGSGSFFAEEWSNKIRAKLNNFNYSKYFRNYSN